MSACLPAVMNTIKLKNKLGDRMIKQLLNSAIAIVICQCLADQLFDLLATYKSRYFARPIIDSFYFSK